MEPSPKRVKQNTIPDALVDDIPNNDNDPHIMVIGDVHVSNNRLDVMSRLRAQLFNLLKRYDDEYGQNVDEYKLYT